VGAWLFDEKRLASFTGSSAGANLASRWTVLEVFDALLNGVIDKTKKVVRTSLLRVNFDVFDTNHRNTPSGQKADGHVLNNPPVMGQGLSIPFGDETLAIVTHIHTDTIVDSSSPKNNGRERILRDIVAALTGGCDGKNIEFSKPTFGLWLPEGTSANITPTEEGSFKVHVTGESPIIIIDYNQVRATCNPKQELGKPIITELFLGNTENVVTIRDGHQTIDLSNIGIHLPDGTIQGPGGNKGNCTQNVMYAAYPGEDPYWIGRTSNGHFEWISTEARSR
jgi:hypothetical protein